MALAGERQEELEHYREANATRLVRQESAIARSSKSLARTSYQYDKLDRCIDDACYYRNNESLSFRRNLAQNASIQPNKKQKTVGEAPIVFGRLRSRAKGAPKPKTVKILLDSGGSGCIIRRALAKKLRKVRSTPTKWTTAAGTFNTNYAVQTQFSLPELHEGRLINWDMHVSDTLSDYDIIVGRDMLAELGIDLLFSSRSVVWDDVSIPFKPRDATMDTDYYVADSSSAAEATERIKQILDAKYVPANLDDVIDSCDHLNDRQKRQLMDVLASHKSLFDGTLGRYRGKPYDIEVKEGAKPYHAKPFPVPRVHEQTLKMEVDRLVQIGVLKKVNRSQWAAPSFIIPKKDGTVRFINDFRELNKRIKRKPYPIPKIQDMMLKLEGFKWATSLDLNMGYYHIELTPASKELCTLVFPWGKYEMQRLPMGLNNSPDIFQEIMGDLFADMEEVRTYIDDILLIDKGSWEEHLDKLAAILTRLKKQGFKVNAKKSFFGRSELEYLGYWITRDGIQPVPTKVDAIKNLAEPTNKKQLRRFIGMVNYYRDMWVRRSHVLSPLTELTSKDAKFVWTDKHRKAFNTMKQILSKETLLAYPNFDLPFDIHTDASQTQLGAVISQKGVPIAFYSRKLQPAQTRYTTTERELLAIVETLKEFRNILLGQRINVYTDHKNLTYKNFNTDRVMRWRLILEEFGPELHHLKGEKNIVADALSRLDMTEESFATMEEYAEYFGLEDIDLPKHLYPLNYQRLAAAQKQDHSLQKNLKEKPSNYGLKSFRGGNDRSTKLIVRKDKDDRIVVPPKLRKGIVQWYHTTLCHPGATRTEATIAQHFYWKGLRTDVEELVKYCPGCQHLKKTTKKYGHLPPKEAECDPWEKLCVDLIGPYKVKLAEPKSSTQTHAKLWCATMIDPATGWFEIVQIKEKDAANIANVVEMTWLTRYPWPTEIIYDRGTEFMAEFAEMVESDYGILRKPCTVRNPQANSILERIHLTIGNLLRSFDLKDLEEGFTFGEAFEGLLSAVRFATRATVHTTLKATPMQLVFGRDAILNTTFEANWKYIKDRKQRLIDQNNARENAKRIPHVYNIGDEVLYRVPVDTKFGEPEWTGPHSIERVHANGTVRLRRGIVTETVNIRNIKPYFTA